MGASTCPIVVSPLYNNNNTGIIVAIIYHQFILLDSRVQPQHQTGPHPPPTGEAALKLLSF